MSLLTTMCDGFTRHRYFNNANPGSSEASFISYYGHGGEFHGIEDRTDFSDSDALLKMKQWTAAPRPTALNANGDGRSDGS